MNSNPCTKLFLLGHTGKCGFRRGVAARGEIMRRVRNAICHTKRKIANFCKTTVTQPKTLRQVLHQRGPDPAYFAPPHIAISWGTPSEGGVFISTLNSKSKMYFNTPIHHHYQRSQRWESRMAPRSIIKTKSIHIL